ncbi:iron-siderophore ABC transporter substrate-binding protein [Rhodococcus sp. SGAir0479]|uniref:iron-siderophore ABC transporter substrate-binding protein n=1 Tax=Rhodococcus sp. SGAir0479 TaxID=2567884 RepID=UPI0010CCF7A5|nr:iron-siderophore ABC transporter substrate-binding protein [Rhodococcus sp. SGAir0479]QCQ90848.1 iron-siderophore ABC transporter substrate-binding protein [Rhodococcus sp. SGAir0479]
MFALTTRRKVATAVAALSATALLASCSSSDSDSSSAAPSDGAFPVTIANTFGSTTIDTAPERIVTLGWNAEDIVYALGGTPVGMPKNSYGAEPNGVMPWLTDKFDASATTLLDATASTPVEAIAALGPDAILAPYEGFDQATYGQLSALAPTVAYPGKAWQTSWQDQTTIIGQAMGKSDDAARLIDSMDTMLADTAAAHPEFAGKTLSVINLDTTNGQVNVYKPTDPRVQVLTQLGFVDSPGVEKIAADSDPDSFFATISAERLGEVDADVVIAFVPDDAEAAKNPTYTSLGAVQRGSAVTLSDTQVIAGLSRTGVLATPWVIDKITPQLSEAAKKAV